MANKMSILLVILIFHVLGYFFIPAKSTGRLGGIPQKDRYNTPGFIFIITLDDCEDCVAHVMFTILINDIYYLG